jgi:hypothetical protein
MDTKVTPNKVPPYKVSPKKVPPCEATAGNVAWLLDKVKNGYTIYDIGPAWNRRTALINAKKSIFGLGGYQIERQTLKNTDALIIKLWKRTGENAGNCPW